MKKEINVNVRINKKKVNTEMKLHLKQKQTNKKNEEKENIRHARFLSLKRE